MKLKNKETGNIYEPSIDWVAHSMLNSGKYEEVKEEPKKKATKKTKKEA